MDQSIGEEEEDEDAPLMMVGPGGYRPPRHSTLCKPLTLVKRQPMTWRKLSVRPSMMVSYCHRHCRVDTERAALYSGADGLSIGKHGRMVEAKADHTRKLTKAGGSLRTSTRTQYRA